MGILRFAFEQQEKAPKKSKKKPKVKADPYAQMQKGFLDQINSQLAEGTPERESITAFATAFTEAARAVDLAENVKIPKGTAITISTNDQGQIERVEMPFTLPDNSRVDFCIAGTTFSKDYLEHILRNSVLRQTDF